MFAQPFSLSHKSWIKSVTFTDSGRLVYSFWFIGVAFFYFFYSSTLRATLLTISYTKPVDTLKGIIKVEDEFNLMIICFAFTEVLDRNLPLYYFGGTSIVQTLRHSPNYELKETFLRATRNKWFYRPTVKTNQYQLFDVNLIFRFRVSRTFWSTESWKRITFCKLWTGSSTSLHLIFTRKRVNNRSGS